MNRREALRNIGAATSALALSTVFGRFAESKANAAESLPTPLYSFLTSLLDADGIDLVGEVRLSNHPTGLYVINKDILGLPWSFNNNVNYSEASGCTNNFKAHESNWRVDSDIFTNVQRPAHDRDIATLLGGKVNAGYWSTMHGSVQYQSNAAIAFEGDDPAVIVAAAKLFNDQFKPTQRELAQSVALTQRTTFHERYCSDTLAGTQYETPSARIIHVNNVSKPYRSSRNNRIYNRGFVAVRPKKGNQRAVGVDVYV